MTAAPPGARGRYASSTAFLLAVNVASAVLGAGQSVVITRALTPAELAVPAVLFAVTATAANFVDFRLGDVAAKLFGATDPEEPTAARPTRRSVIQFALLGDALLALALFVVAVPLAYVSAALLLDRDVTLVWIAGQAAAGGLGFLVSSAVYVFRLTEDFTRLGWIRLANQGVGVAALVAALAIAPSLDGYFVGVVAVNLLQLVVTFAMAEPSWRRAVGGPLLGRGAMSARAAFRGEVRTALAGGAFGASKLLHRAADVLVVSALGSDRETGLYRLARTATDALYLGYDAINQVQMPRLLAMFRAGDEARLSRDFRRFVAGAGALTAMIVAGGVFVLPSVVDVLFPAYDGMAPIATVLAVAFFFVTGVHVWVWPWLLTRGGLGRFAVRAFVASVAQPAVAVATAAGGLRAGLAGAAGYVAYYVILYPWTVGDLRRRWRSR
ncbi:MAG TPA: oligosaccharide flippase family protein [Acidimicrobiales bacterium]